eukprot:485347-Prymnesium_polylepis.2
MANEYKLRPLHWRKLRRDAVAARDGVWGAVHSGAPTATTPQPSGRYLAPGPPCAAPLSVARRGCCALSLGSL